MSGLASDGGSAVDVEPSVALDAYAVIAFQQMEGAAETVRDLIRGGAAISTVNAAEVVYRAVRFNNAVAADVTDEFDILGIRVDPLSKETGIEAGRLRSIYYAPRTSEVSLADCVAAAHALALDLPLATADEPLALMVEAEGGSAIRLPQRS